MKNVFTVLLLIFSFSLYAQEDVTKFLGIPVDGSKSEMISKLKEKGFRSAQTSNDILVGDFNGAKVNVYVVTNNDKVCRIMVSDVNTVDARSIQIRFNNLCGQFANHSKYVSVSDNTIPENEDISYEMITHNKRYEAVFYQQPAAMDSVTIMKEIMPVVLSKYTKEQLENPTEELKSDIIKFSTEYATTYIIEQYSKKPVWFMISENYGKYYITMFYDNEYNRANGEDL